MTGRQLAISFVLLQWYMPNVHHSNLSTYYSKNSSNTSYLNRIKPLSNPPAQMYTHIHLTFKCAIWIKNCLLTCTNCGGNSQTIIWINNFEFCNFECAMWIKNCPSTCISQLRGRQSDNLINKVFGKITFLVQTVKISVFKKWFLSSKLTFTLKVYRY